MPYRKNRQEVAHIRQEPAFSHHSGTPQPLPSIPEAGFGYPQKNHTIDTFLFIRILNPMLVKIFQKIFAFWLIFEF